MFISSRKLIKVGVIGSTGSVGCKALEVLQNAGNFRVEYLGAGNNANLLLQQIKSFHPSFASLQNCDDRSSFSKEADRKGTKVLYGDDAILELSTIVTDIAILAISGNRGVKIFECLLKSTKKIAIANKETIVTLGSLFRNMIKKYEIDIFPLDSEHHSIYSVIGDLEIKNKSIKSIVITCSGGPFRNYSKEEIANVSYEQSIQHPVWSMGWENSVNSATLFNKGMEIIEAFYLFNLLSANEIDVVIHPEAFFHAFIIYNSGLWKGVAHNPDMSIPFLSLFDLEYKNHESISNPVNFLTKKSLLFYEVNKDIFPSIDLAYYALSYPLGGCIYSRFNSIAISLFKKSKISFYDIFYIVERSLHLGYGEYKERVFSSIDEINSALKDIEGKMKKVI